MIAKTTAERQAEYRQRKAKAGEPEVRGIYAPKDSHDAIRAAAKVVVEERNERARHAEAGRRPVTVHVLPEYRPEVRELEARDVPR